MKYQGLKSIQKDAGTGRQARVSQGSQEAQEAKRSDLSDFLSLGRIIAHQGRDNALDKRKQGKFSILRGKRGLGKQEREAEAREGREAGNRKREREERNEEWG